ncbi:MAG TPA: AAA domain-containing protein [Dermatophilaceae bacterium]|nr:AAA domain-containing protein [Dermatophilaceae bacterium]
MSQSSPSPLDPRAQAPVTEAPHRTGPRDDGPRAGADPRPRVVPHPDSQSEVDARSERVAAAVKTWQRHLVDLGGRNSLLWYRDLPVGTLDLAHSHPTGVAGLLAGRETHLSDLIRDPSALDDARKRARAISAKARELQEERGIATCFLATGMATWTVRGASRPPAAPVLLRACTLRATGAAQEDFILDLGQDVQLNPVLEHYLRSEQGIELDTDGLEELATDTSGFGTQPVYAALAAACAKVPDFEVAPRLVLGTFSYAKLPMVADLGVQGVDLANHDVIAALAGDPEAMRSVRRSLPDPEPDADPAREHLILDADSSQQAAIDAVRSGAHLVIKGPPGTGKSQTIANLIASLVGEGRRVLFVAEKRAAIDAVLGRLHRVGLSDLVLDAYDGASNRRRLAQEFGRVLDADAAVADADTAALERVLLQRRDRLVRHSHALHDQRKPWGVSAHEAQEAISEMASRPHPPRSHVRIPSEPLGAIDRERAVELGAALAEAAALGAWSLDDPEDPWYGARIETADEAVRARDIVSRLSGDGLDRVEKVLAQVFTDVRLPQATRVVDWGDVLRTVGKVRDTFEVFKPVIFDQPLGDMVAATGSRDFRRHVRSNLGWWERYLLRRQARSMLRPGPRPESLHAALIDAQDQRTAWREMAGAGGRPEIPADLDRAQTAYADLAEDLAWLGERLASTPGGDDLVRADIADLRKRLGSLAAHPERLSVIPRVIGTLDALRADGLGALVDDLATRGVDPQDVPTEVDFVWSRSVADELAVRDPAYGAHQGDHLRSVAREYIAADRAHIAAGAARVRADVSDRLRRTLVDHPEQESLVRAEAGKSRRHRALRALLPMANETLTAIKPAWMMSPLVVASVLPPGRWFDVVIFDEASQIPPAQAISAIARARQVVVAGDERQLPPTTFFTSAIEDLANSQDDDSLAEGFESVLDVLAATLPTRRLTWHYRSHDERLVAFANQQIYEGSLVTFPGTGVEPVVTLVPVDGHGMPDPGQEGVESTAAEVDRVVELVLLHARTRPRESLGVIALGIKHAVRIEEALRRALSSVEGAEGVGDFFAEDIPERFFVKNLERVQGDERDAIILSIGYGKTPHGRVLHRFGPLNLEGGERRLNVAMTRARKRMTVVSALAAEDLDPARLKARGATMLRDFLAYAATGGARPAADSLGGSSVNGAGSALLGEFAKRLRNAGLTVHEHYGHSGHPIDLAVEDANHRGRVLVAVETDGRAYAGMRSTRDRDRLRVEQLERLGWEHMRVWTTDLFRDPARDVARVLQAANRSRPNGHVTANGSSAGPVPQAVVPAGASVPGGASEGGPEPLVGVRAPEHGEAGSAPGDGAASRADAFPPAQAVGKGRSSEGDSAGDGHGSEPEGATAGEAEVSPAPASPAAKKGRRGGRRRRAPEQTCDDTDAFWGELGDESARERWLKEQRPPHWD